MKIFLIGFMCSGKTFWGRQLSQKLGIPFFDLDEKIEESESKSINAIFDENGEEYFRLKEKDALHMITESHDNFVMATGGGTPCYFNNIEFMNRAGTTVWMHVPLETLSERLVRERHSRPLIRHLEEHQLESYIIKKYSDRKIYYEQANVVMEEDDSLEKLVEKTFHAS